MKALETNYSINFDIKFYEAGDECYKKRGTLLPPETIEGIKKADASIKGPVGETVTDVVIKLRQMLELFANIRPAKKYLGLRASKNIDLIIVRENTKELYKGLGFEVDGKAIGIRVITEKTSIGIAQQAIEIAERRRKITIVHKANVMKKTYGLFAKVAREEIAKYSKHSL